MRFQRLGYWSVFGHPTVISGKRQEISAYGRSNSAILDVYFALYTPHSGWPHCCIIHCLPLADGLLVPREAMSALSSFTSLVCVQVLIVIYSLFNAVSVCVHLFMCTCICVHNLRLSSCAC